MKYGLLADIELQQMQRECKYFVWLLLTLLTCQSLSAQEHTPADSTKKKHTSSENEYVVPPGEAPFIVRNIYIEGNKKTRPSVLLRELSFKSGDEYLLQDLVKKFETARRQLMNLALFHEVVVALKSFDGYNVDVLVQVRERWYLFPVPYLKPVDRNLNQWIVEQHASLDRVNYGLKLLYNNATGRNDKLRFWLISGYTRQVVLNYDRPFFDRKMRWGWSGGLSFGKNKEVNYNTIENKQVFLKDEAYIRNFSNAYGELSYRRAIKTKHRFGIGYTNERVADTVVNLNPDYFNNASKRIKFPELYYIMTYYNLDYIPYPTKGYAAELAVSKKGFNKQMNSWQFTAKASANWRTGKKTFFSLNGYGMVKLPYNQPYYNRRFLGYSDVFLQGYEYYVIDGLAGGYIKASFNRKLFNFAIRLPGTKKIAPLRVPFNIYGRIYGNAGYTYSPTPGNNSLSNKMLYSSGFGIDITSIYDFTLKLDWSFNQLGQNGLFLHRKTIF